VLGIVILALAASQIPVDKIGLILFVSMAVVAELTSVELFVSSRSRVSVSTIIAIATVLVFGPLAGVFSQAAAGLMSILTTSYSQQELKERRANWLQRAAFNTGMYVISSACAGLVYVLAGGQIGQIALATNLLPLFLAVSADMVVNLTLLIGVISLQTGQSPLEVWQRDFQWGLPILLVGSLVGGGILALAYQLFSYLGLAVFFLPVLSIGYSFRLYVGQTRVYVNRLEVLNATLDNANLGLLEALGAVIDAYDVYTYGHSAQVAVYAGALAEKLDLPKEEQALVVKAALIHDVGKIGIMDNIIGKQGPLTEEEKNIMKQHPVIGADIVRRMDGLQALVPLVRHHHERWDGGGYPAGLAEEEIPLGARVIALADALDAMSSDRPYRALLKASEIKTEIRINSGKQFDPRVVQAFQAVIEEIGDGFFTNSAAAVDSTVLANEIGNVSQGVRYLKKSMLIDPRS
jgi:putative nucleotidyltransferase with HDIG domain